MAMPRVQTVDSLPLRGNAQTEVLGVLGLTD